MKVKIEEIAKILGKSSRTVYDWSKNEQKAHIIQILIQILEVSESPEDISNIQFFKPCEQKSNKKNYVKSIQKLLHISPRNYQSWKSVYPNLMTIIYTVFRHEYDDEYFLTHDNFENINIIKNKFNLDKQLIGEIILFSCEDLKINDTRVYNTIEKRLDSGNFENLKLLDTNSTILIDNQKSILVHTQNKVDQDNTSLIQTLKTLQLDRDNNYRSFLINAIKNNNIAEFKFLIGLLSQKIYHSFSDISLKIVDRIDLINYLIKLETDIFVKRAKSNEKEIKLLIQDHMSRIYNSLVNYNMMLNIAIKYAWDFGSLKKEYAKWKDDISITSSFLTSEVFYIKKRFGNHCFLLQ